MNPPIKLVTYAQAVRDKNEPALNESGYSTIPISESLNDFGKVRGYYLSLIPTYLILNNIPQVRLICRLCTSSFRKRESRLDLVGICESDPVDQNLMNQLAQSDLKDAIYYFIADPTSENVKKYFGWALEDATITEEELEWRLHNYKTDRLVDVSTIAVSYSWRGYALIALGRPGEALPFLRQVIPLFEEDKKHGWEIYQKIEYSFPFALIPLCEYLLDPTPEKRVAAQNGREDYLKKLSNIEQKFDGYLFYYHLGSAFPDIYIPPIKKKRSAKKKIVEEKPVPEVLLEIPDYPDSHRMDKPGKGGVVIQDTVDNNFGFVLRVPSFDRFIKKVKTLEGYPIFSDAFMAFTIETPLEPELVIEECNRLLKEPSLTIEEREAVGEIGEIAMHARDHGAEIQFLFTEYW